MTDVLARYKSGKLIFETIVNLDSAMKLKKGEPVNINEVLRDNFIYTDQKKGMRAGKDELENTFNTTDLIEITKKIIEKGELEITQEYRDEALEQRKKQVIEFLKRNSVDSRTNRPFTPDILESALKQAGIRIDNQSVEKQISRIIEKIKLIIPLKIETKKIKINIPAEYTGRIYGLLQEYKEKEDWLGNGSLEVVVNIPVGIQTDFYDKLNSITHGSAITQEIKEQ